MNPNDVVSVIERLGELLSPTAAKAWEIAMRQVSTGVVRNCAWVLLWASGLWMTLRWYAKEKADEYGGDNVGPVIVGVILVLILALNVDYLISLAMNPDYYALKILLNLMVKGD